MSNRTFFVSDTHFSHANTFEKFKNEDGSPLRPFTSIEEMDSAMASNWNNVVGPNDIVYHLGDVVVNKKKIGIVHQLNGHKRLILGNHDLSPMESYLEAGFERVYAMKVLDDMILTHVPIHPDSVERFGCNVHGHLHGGRVMWEYKTKYHDLDTSIDPRYFSVCVEQIDFTPIELPDLRERIKKQQKAAGYDPKEAWGNGHGPAL